MREHLFRFKNALQTIKDGLEKMWLRLSVNVAEMSGVHMTENTKKTHR